MDSPPMISKYQCILWDFDGVIIDSDKVRVLGFQKVLEQYPAEQIDRLIQFHTENGGLSRYVKFRYFFENIRIEPVDEKSVNDLAQRFSAIMKTNLISPELLIKDSVYYIKRNYLTTEMNIVSGSDENELKFLASELGIANYFRTIQGSPIPKVTLVERLIAAGTTKREYICLIGDSENDLDAALKNGIDFFGYNNPGLLTKGRGYIERFSQLK